MTTLRIRCADSKQGETVTLVLDMDFARTHPSALYIGHGWLILADRNIFKKIFLVSKHQPIIVPFEHGEPYHSFLRATMLAMIHAQNNPQIPLSETVPARKLAYMPLLSIGDQESRA